MKRVGLILFSFLVLFGCKQGKKYHDEIQVETALDETDPLRGIQLFQSKLNAEFKDPEISPLPDRFRKDFESLDFFTPNIEYIVKAKLVRTPEALPFLMPTTTDRKSEEVVFGVAHFLLKGETHQLEIYQNQELVLEQEHKEYLFLPFTDKTNGEETYAGGRYLDLTIPEGDSIVIDFNKAYNPYCVYNKKYSCPIVPSVNTLDIRILAGVKDFKVGKK